VCVCGWVGGWVRQIDEERGNVLREVEPGFVEV